MAVSHVPDVRQKKVNILRDDKISVSRGPDLRSRMWITLGLLVGLLAGSALCQCPQNQLYADTSDNTCQRYFECYNNNYYTSYCPSDQVFYPGLNQCVIRSSYDCVCNSPSCVRPNCTGTENTDIQDKGNCSNYIYCNGRYPLRRTCPSGYLFNPEQRACESRSTTKYLCPFDPFTCPQSQGSYEDPRDPNCQTYYICNNGQAFKQVCENNYHYYGKLNRCVLPDSYDCHESPQFQCPAPDQDFADPKDRTCYFYCMGNAPLRRRCPQGQYFNPDPNVRRCA